MGGGCRGGCQGRHQNMSEPFHVLILKQSALRKHEDPNTAT
jgi:hypothetical protein